MQTQYKAEIEYFKKYETYRKNVKPFGKLTALFSNNLKSILSSDSSVSENSIRVGGAMVITLEELG